MEFLTEWLRDRKRRKIISKWIDAWNSKRGIDNPIAANGYCVMGKPISEDLYYEAIVFPNLQILEIKSSHDVLDVGCGSGLHLAEIEKIGARAVGADFSQEMLNKYTGHARLICSEALSLTFPSESFDRILLVSVSHYFPSFEYFKTVVQNLCTMLRPGGRLLVGDMLFGVPSKKTSYLHYDREKLNSFLDELAISYIIQEQNEKKKIYNQRWDLVIDKPIH